MKVKKSAWPRIGTQKVQIDYNDLDVTESDAYFENMRKIYEAAVQNFVQQNGDINTADFRRKQDVLLQAISEQRVIWRVMKMALEHLFGMEITQRAILTRQRREILWLAKIQPGFDFRIPGI